MRRQVARYYYCNNFNSLFTSFLSHQVPIFAHMHSVHFSAFCMHYPQCTTLTVRTRNCRLLQRHFRDVTLTPARITDITLSRMTLGKCRLLRRHFRDVTLTSARITDITLSRKCFAPAAILCPGFCTRSLRRRSERQKSVKHFRTIHTPRSLPDEGGDVCAKFGSDWFRNVDLYKMQTNKQTNFHLYILDFLSC